MKRHVWMVWLAVLKAVFVVAAAFATGGADEAADDTADNVFLGEQDLAERMEIWRNQYRRMTPGDAPLVQDIGTWPAVWEEFSRAWDAAPAERDLATWLVPVVSERTGSLTVLRDADGNARWSGATDFAKEGAESVTLTGALVSEEDWALWQAARAEIARRLGMASPPRLRDGEGGGTGGEDPGPKMFVSAIACLTNDPPEFRVGLQWTNDVIMEVFAYGPLHVAETNTVTYTNDENQVITTNVVSWHSVEPGLTGRYDNHWEHVGTVALTNDDEVVFVDTNFLPERSVVRFYAAFAQGDADNDGLNDAFETQILNTSTNSDDSDGDGIPDGVEYAARSNPSVSNIWWVTKTTNEYFKVFNLGNCAPPHTPQDVTNLPVVANPPSSNSVVVDVTITGFVDDAIRVDGNGVDFGPDTQRFNMRHITNEIAELQSGRFMLTLVDYPRSDYSGPNEAKLGWNDTDKFSVEWTWRVPIAVKMEPVFTSATLPLDNPSGIIQGSNAWFHVDVLPPEVVPETNILWTAQVGNIVLTPTNRGSRVCANAASVGDDELQVTVEGTLGSADLPPFRVKVKPLNIVSAQVGVLEDEDENWVVTSDRVWEIIHEANGVLAQTGIQIAVQPPYHGISDSADCWDLPLASDQVVSALMGKLPSGNGIEIYFVNTILRRNGGYDLGVNTPNGIALSAMATGRTLAHEIGHACGMPDIYAANTNAGLAVTGCVTNAWMPQDWGNYLTDVDTLEKMSNVVKRLMMHGVGRQTSIQGDVPSGTIHGVGFERYWINGTEHREWMMDDWEVGLPGMVTQPHHQ